MRIPWLTGLVALFALTTSGCTDSAGDDDDAADDDACVDDDDSQNDDDDDSTDGPQQAVPSQARLVRLGAGDPFIGGPGASAREGDYLLYNRMSRYVIRGPRDGDFLVGVPGAVIDADIVRFSEQADRDAIYEVVTMLGPGRIFVPETFQILTDGSHTGDDAELEVTGTDGPLDLLSAVTGETYESLGLQVIQSYKLNPINPTLTIQTKILNDSGETVEIEPADLVFLDRDAYELFVAGVGFVDEPAGQEQRTLGLLSRRNDHAFGIFGYDDLVTIETLDGLRDHYDHLVAAGPAYPLGPGGHDQYKRGLCVTIDLAMIDMYRRVMWGIDPLGGIEGKIHPIGSNAGLGGTRIFLTDPAGNPHNVCVAGNFGGYQLQADAGDWNLAAIAEGGNEDFDISGGFGAYGAYAQDDRNEVALRIFEAPETVLPVPFAEGYLRADPIPITVTGERIHEEFHYDPPATLAVRVEDGEGQPIPAVVHVDLVGNDPQPPDWRVGERRPADGSRKVIWLVDGEAEVPIVPGTYDLTAQRGFRYELDTADHQSLVSGQRTEVTLTIPRAYETPGYVSADLDSHAALSPDGRCSIEERLAAAAASDVQVHVATERDHVVDYSDVVEAMGLAEQLVSVPGLEVTTPQYGSFNIYPLEPDPGAVNGGAVLWWEVGGHTQDLVDELHALGDVLVQVNSGRADGGMLDNAGYNANSGQAQRPARYSSDFEVLELLNGQHHEDTDALRRDWCAHLDQGLRPTAVGASDAHDRLDGTGGARTYIAAGTDDVADLDLDELFDALHGGRAVVSGGPFVLLEAEALDGTTAGVGETLAASSATLHIEVMAPSWMDLDTVRLYTDGCQLVGSYSVGASSPPVRFETDVNVAPGGDAYYFVEVVGSDSMDPVWPDAAPYAVTNPVFLAP